MHSVFNQYPQAWWLGPPTQCAYVQPIPLSKNVSWITNIRLCDHLIGTFLPGHKGCMPHLITLSSRAMVLKCWNGIGNPPSHFILINIHLIHHYVIYLWRYIVFTINLILTSTPSYTKYYLTPCLLFVNYWTLSRRSLNHLLSSTTNQLTGRFSTTLIRSSPIQFLSTHCLCYTRPDTQTGGPLVPHPVERPNTRPRRYLSCYPDRQPLTMGSTQCLKIKPPLHYPVRYPDGWPLSQAYSPTHNPLATWS